jgi:hypothetical protein
LALCLDVEPVVTLASGVAVLQAVYETLLWAQNAGYCVSFDTDGLLSVCPDTLNDNARHIFESNASHVELILAQQSVRFTDIYCKTPWAAGCRGVCPRRPGVL